MRVHGAWFSETSAKRYRAAFIDRGCARRQYDAGRSGSVYLDRRRAGALGTVLVGNGDRDLITAAGLACRAGGVLVAEPGESQDSRSQVDSSLGRAVSPVYRDLMRIIYARICEAATQGDRVAYVDGIRAGREGNIGRRHVVDRGCRACRTGEPEYIRHREHRRVYAVVHIGVGRGQAAGTRRSVAEIP